MSFICTGCVLCSFTFCLLSVICLFSLSLNQMSTLPKHMDYLCRHQTFSLVMIETWGLHSLLCKYWRQCGNQGVWKGLLLWAVSVSREERHQSRVKLKRAGVTLKWRKLGLCFIIWDDMLECRKSNSYKGINVFS